MRDLFAFFWRRYRARTVAIIALLCLTALLDLFSLSTILPLLHSLTQTPSEFTMLHFFSVSIEASVPELLAMIALLLLAKGVVRWLAMRQVAQAAVSVAHGLRADLQDAIMAASWRFFVQTPAGHLSAAVAVEAYRAAFAYRRACAALVAALQLLFAVSLVIAISAWAGLTALLIGALVAWLLRFTVRVGRAAGNAQTEHTRTLAARVSDAAHALKPARSMGRAAGITRWLATANSDLQRAEAKQLRASEALQAAQEPVIALSVALTLYLTFVLSNQSAPALLMLGLLFYRVLQQTGAVLMEYQGVVLGEASFRAIRAQTERARALPESTNRGNAEASFSTELRFNAVSFAYDDQPVLRDLDLTIPCGSLVLIAGPSGAGKTTILDLIAGLYQPVRGTISADGRSLEQLDLHAWRRQLGYVTQEPALLHDTIRENLTLGETIPELRLHVALEQARASFVEDLPDGLNTIVGEQGLRLSGGQRQRLALARALVHEPRLLLLDEPTANVDPDTHDAIAAALAELKGRCTIVIVSHNPSFERIADAVYQVSQGAVLQSA